MNYVDGKSFSEQAILSVTTCLTKALKPAQAEGQLSEFIESLGFKFYSYAAAPSQGTSKCEGLTLSNYPSSWRRTYQQKSYHCTDPVVAEGRRAILPYHWGGNNYVHRLRPSERRMFLEARDCGIAEGFTVPVHGTNGGYGLFSVTNFKDSPDLLVPSNTIYQLLVTVARFVHAYDSTDVGNGVETPHMLTSREAVCLEWTLNGKTSWEIAQIVGISKPTVEYHLRKVIRKLGAANRTHAAAIALKSGLI